MKSPTGPFYPLSPVAWHVLATMNASAERFTLAQLERAVEKKLPALGLAELRRGIQAALVRLEREGVAAVAVDPHGRRWWTPTTLPAASRAALLLSKPPCKGKRHARTIQGQPQHERGGATVPDQPTPDSRGAQAVDAGGVPGADAGAGSGAASPTGQETPAPLVLTPRQATTAAPDDLEAPVVETVRVVDPEARL